MVNKQTNYLYNMFYGSVIFLLLTLNGCNTNNQENGGAKMVAASNETEILLEKILKHPDLEQYYHSEIKNRVPIIVKINEDFDTKINITMFDRPIQLIKSTQVLSKEIPFFEINSFHITDNEATFNIAYSVEGILIKGKLIHKNNSWIFLEYSIIER